MSGSYALSLVVEHGMSISLLEPSRRYTASVGIAYNRAMSHVNYTCRARVVYKPRDYVSSRYVLYSSPCYRVAPLFAPAVRALGPRTGLLEMDTE